MLCWEAITVIYTSLGGLRPVVFTDVIQMTILFGGAILAVIMIRVETGGVSAWWPSEWSSNWQEPEFGPGLNSSCSVVTVDFIDRFRKARETELDHVRLARYISVVINAIVVVLSSFVGVVHGNMLEIAYKVTNLLVVPLFGLFFMEMFVRRATPLGTIVGAIAGLTVVSTINDWQEITGTQGISLLWAMPLSFLAQIGVKMIVSLLPIGRRPEVKPVDLVAD